MLRHLRLLGGEDVWEELMASKVGIEFDGLSDTYKEVRETPRRNVLKPRSVINHRRSVYQEDEPKLRITIDDQIATFEPVPGLYDSVSALTRDALGPPVEVFGRALVKVTSKDEGPDWLARALEAHGAKPFGRDGARGFEEVPD